jgi:hypothetical protein
VLVNAQRVVDLRTSKLLVQHLAEYLTLAGAIDTAVAPRLRIVSQPSTP